MDVYIPAGLVPAAYGLLFETWMNSMEPILRRANLSPTELKEKDPLLGIGILASNDEWSITTDNNGNIIAVEYGGASEAWRKRLDAWLANYDLKRRDDGEKEQACFEEGVVFGHQLPELMVADELVDAAAAAAHRYSRDDAEWGRHGEALKAMFSFGYGVGSHEEHQEPATPETPAPLPPLESEPWFVEHYTAANTPLIAGMGDAELRRLGQQFGANVGNRIPQNQIPYAARLEFAAMNINNLWTDEAREVFIDGATNPPPEQRTFTRYDGDLEAAIIDASVADAAEQGHMPGWQDLAEQAKAHINRLVPAHPAWLSQTDYNALLVAYGAGYADKVAKDEGFPPYDQPGSEPGKRVVLSDLRFEREENSVDAPGDAFVDKLSFSINGNVYQLTCFSQTSVAELHWGGHREIEAASASDALAQLLIRDAVK